VKPRRATTADAAALSALAERTFRATFGPDNTAADMDLHCARSFSPELQRRELANPAVATWLVEDADGSAVAYAQAHRGSAPPGVGGERPLELLRFYVDAEWHGRGLAAALMETVLEHARETGADVLWLGVWEHNPRAMRFYAKHGFAICGEQVFVLGSDPQRDLVMARRVNDAKRPT
jgi:GNAT superfamily N-acetyltransferase